MPTTTSSTASLAERAVLAVRELIHDGGLLPGQPIRQLALAEQLGMSRVPLREALKNLQADGLVTASPTGGFEVTRLSADELGQFYLMRRLLESELELLAGLNARMAEMVDQPSRELRALNREFHFRIFGLAAGLGHVVAEVSRLWDRTVPYRAVYSSERSARALIVAEHDALLAALGDRDVERLVEVMDGHRAASERDVVHVLTRPGPRPG